ncbi:MAG: hypothetical protein LUG51_06605 [Tannerellaceae bacterium]|nr:hypothetical protein [Tannerellaceae bacterium]
MKKLFLLFCGLFVFLVIEQVQASSPEFIVEEQPGEMVDAVLATGYADVIIIKNGPGASSTTNDLSYGATVHTNLHNGFTSSLNPSNNQITDKGKVGIHTVTSISASRNLLSIYIYGCPEGTVSLTEIGAKFTLREGGSYKIVMEFGPK